MLPRCPLVRGLARSRVASDGKPSALAHVGIPRINPGSARPPTSDVAVASVEVRASVDHGGRVSLATMR